MLEQTTGAKYIRDAAASALDARLLLKTLTALKKGDFSVRLPGDWTGESGMIAETLNDVIDINDRLAREMERVSRVVGREGKITQRATPPVAQGSWVGLIESVNTLIDDLVQPTTEMSRVIGAVANGDLSQTMALEVGGRRLQGEFLRVVKLVNAMVTQLGSFASEVTRVALEVGVEGKLGGQANVPGASGAWRDLTDNVNQLAANLTTQVRAIAEVSTAVTQGDLTRSIAVEAQGEVAFLKDNINEMIRNLEDTTQKNKEQDWLKTNLARFSSMLQGQRDMTTLANMILSELAPLVDAQQGLFYVNQTNADGVRVMKLLGGYAYTARKNLANEFRPGEGLIGQCMLGKRRILLTNAPPDYVVISSGLGESAPLNVVVLPALFEDEVKAVIELASFNRFSETHIAFLDQLTGSIGIVINTIEANTRTERLLIQSQQLAAELLSQQEELKKTNERLEQQAHTLRESEERLRADGDNSRVAEMLGANRKTLYRKLEECREAESIDEL
jgi:methyl-accepting chemotaxis protein